MMLSAWLVTNARPRRIHIVPSVMMNECTPSPITMIPLASPHIRLTLMQVASPRATVATGPIGPTARSTIAMVTPETAYTAPTDRSMPPAMMTIVAPTPMIANPLASVAIWSSVYLFRKLLTVCPVNASTCDPAVSVNTTLSATSTPSRPSCGERRTNRSHERPAACVDDAPGTAGGLGEAEGAAWAGWCSGGTSITVRAAGVSVSNVTARR